MIATDELSCCVPYTRYGKPSVAVYSIWGVKPCKPQSQVGPMRTLVRRPNPSHNASGTTSNPSPISDMPKVDTVPPNS